MPGDPALPDLDLLLRGRVHEATGFGRRIFACAVIARFEGPVVWIHDARMPEGVYPPGLATFFDPGRMILVQPTGTVSLLRAMETALRSGVAPLVVTELAEAPDLTASRRLQLAAGEGRGRGLCLVPEGKLRTNASETRWQCTPIPGGWDARQHWEIVKNKRGRLGAWQVRWNRRAKRFEALDTSVHDARLRRMPSVVLTGLGTSTGAAVGVQA